MVVRRGHAFAHEDGVRTGTPVVLHFDCAEHAGFRHLDHIIGQIAREFAVCAHIDPEVLQVARVDANHLCTGRYRTVDLFARMRLHEGGHAELVRQCEQVHQFVIAERSDDEQHQIGAVRARLPDLVVGGDEILA